MEYLIYRSKALVDPGSTACRDIVGVSQRRNEMLGLTGFLHAEQGLFIQYLEGPAAPLWDLYKRLHLDDRHTGLVLLGEGRLKKPRFAGWSMGYSERNVLSCDDFLKEVSYHNGAEEASSKELIYFLMAVNARIDLGIVNAPQASWQ